MRVGKQNSWAGQMGSLGGLDSALVPAALSLSSVLTGLDCREVNQMGSCGDL